MPLWMVRAGRHGEQEAKAIDNSFVAIGWIDLPDLSNIRTKDELKRLYNKEYPGRKKMRVANEVGQIWRFFKEISIGDLVALPLKAQSAIAIGKVTSPYEYRKDFGDIIRHIRKVDWIKVDIPRTDFDQDLLYSLGAAMTVCQISRNDAEARVKAMVEGKKIKVARRDEIEATEKIRIHLSQKLAQILAIAFLADTKKPQ